MTVDQALRHFRTFLDTSLPVVRGIVDSKEYPAIRADWIQANWEILIEAVLRSSPKQFLEVYGDGADCNGTSSRVWQPLAAATHRIYCSPIGESSINVLNSQTINYRELPFDRFVCWDGQKYDESPPFDFVMLQDANEQIIVHLSEVVFSLKQIVS